MSTPEVTFQYNGQTNGWQTNGRQTNHSADEFDRNRLQSTAIDCNRPQSTAIDRIRPHSTAFDCNRMDAND
jgi:hypothetical protein